MKKIILASGIVFLSSISFSKVFVKINEPIRFKDFNIKGLDKNYIVGEGSFEVFIDNEEADLGKKIKFKFPEDGFMSNKKNVIKVKKYLMESKDKSMIIKTKREIIKFFAFVDKRNILNNKDTQLIEGEYEGKIPVIFSIYKKNEVQGDKS